MTLRSAAWMCLFGFSLWAADSQRAFALPYGDGTVRDALLESTKRIPTKKLHKALIGEWQVRAPEQILRQIRILELAINPTTERSAFDALSPTEEEIHTFEAFQILLQKDKNGPEILEARGRIQALNDNQISFTESKSIFRVAGAEREQSYRVIGSSPNVLKIFWIEANETNECVFIDTNHVRIFADDKEKVRLERE